MQQFAMSKSLHPRRWLLAGRVLVALTVVCILVGILGNIPAAIHYSNSGDLFRQTAIAYSQSNLALADDLASQASKKASNGDRAASIQRFSEVIALFAIITAFCIVTLSSLQIIGVALRYLITKSRNSEQQDALGKLFAAASEQGNALYRKVTLTFIFIFCAVLVRSILSTLYALAQALQDSGSACASISSYCDPCLNVYSHIMGWIVYTPTFQQVPHTALKPLPLRACLVAHTARSCACWSRRRLRSSLRCGACPAFASLSSRWPSRRSPFTPGRVTLMPTPDQVYKKRERMIKKEH